MYALVFEVIGDVKSWRPVDGYVHFITCAFVVFSHRWSTIVVLHLLCGGILIEFANLVVHIITTDEFVVFSPCTSEPVWSRWCDVATTFYWCRMPENSIDHRICHLCVARPFRMDYTNAGGRQGSVLDIILAHLSQGSSHGVVLFVRILELSKISVHLFDLFLCRLALLFRNQNRIDLVEKATDSEASDRRRILVRAVPVDEPSLFTGRLGMIRRVLFMLAETVSIKFFLEPIKIVDTTEAVF